MPEVYDAKQAQAALGVKAKQLQNYARDGKIRFKAIQQGAVQKRLYNGEDVERLKADKENFRPLTKAPAKEESKALVVMKTPPQELRALDMVSIAGQQAIGYKGAIEAVATESRVAIQAVASEYRGTIDAIFAHLKSEADAQREREKANREDARERFDATEKRLNAEREDQNRRWELERRDKLARLEMRRGKKLKDREPEPETPQKLNGKAKAAKAL